jgi:hypothetical protein
MDEDLFSKCISITENEIYLALYIIVLLINLLYYVAQRKSLRARSRNSEKLEIAKFSFSYPLQILWFDFSIDTAHIQVTPLPLVL